MKMTASPKMQLATGWDFARMFIAGVLIGAAVVLLFV